MSTFEKLAAILAAVHVDPGQRGLGRIPGDNLFTATVDDFSAACHSLAAHAKKVRISTGFFIPSAIPAAYETDGPLGAFFLEQTFHALGICCKTVCEEPVARAMNVCRQRCGIPISTSSTHTTASHFISIERGGPAADGKRYTMRGADISRFLQSEFDLLPQPGVKTIGIGDGGNEIGMGKIRHETIVQNIPNGDLIHCRVPVDYLLVAGVSNWGAYALAAGLFILNGTKPPETLFDPDTERSILESMVREGPLVDGVSGTLS